MSYSFWDMKDVVLSELTGQVIVAVDGLREDSQEGIFTLSDGRKFVMAHDQDCCEHVEINDICGDVDDLVGATIVHFEERSNSGTEWDNPEKKPGEYSESWTWTFYDIQTNKGCVNIRWLGESNGYYSEGVDVKWFE